MSLFMEVWQEEKTVYMVSDEKNTATGWVVTPVQAFDTEAEAVSFMEKNEEFFC
jgi:hypothetical protein